MESFNSDNTDAARKVGFYNTILKNIVYTRRLKAYWI